MRREVSGPVVDGRQTGPGVTWPKQPLAAVAPAEPSPIRFKPDEHVWHLTLDQIESGTGRIVNARSAPAREAGTSTYSFDEAHVLYSKLRPYLNKVVRPLAPGIATTELVPLRPRPEVLLPEFLAYYLRAPGFLAFASSCVAGTKMPRVMMQKVWKHEIPLPPLSEQRRIVEILDQADRLRRLRAEADAKADRILPALFIKMFGDPASNPKGWLVRSLADVCEIVSGATPRTDQPSHWGGDIYWATPKDLSGLDDFVIERTERTITTSGLASCSARMLPKGAILLSSRAPIGLVAIAGAPMCTNQGFKSFVCGPDMSPWYLFAWCKLQTGFLDSLGRGATFKEISKAIVERIQIQVPPLQLQSEFEGRAKALRDSRLSGRRATDKLASLFALLLNKAFSGSLTAPWRQAHMNEALQEMEQQTKALAALTRAE